MSGCRETRMKNQGFVLNAKAPIGTSLSGTSENSDVAAHRKSDWGGVAVPKNEPVLSDNQRAKRVRRRWNIGGTCYASRNMSRQKRQNPIRRLLTRLCRVSKIFAWLRSAN